MTNKLLEKVKKVQKIKKILFNMDSPRKPWDKDITKKYKDFLLRVENADHYIIRTVENKNGEVIFRFIDNDGLDFINEEAFE